MSNYSKVYECNDYVFPCNIIYNEEKKLYEVYYNEYNYNICLGYINKKCNKIVNDIINNKKIINGGIQLLGGKYIEYDYIDKMNKGFDDYSIFIKIRYE